MLGNSELCYNLYNLTSHLESYEQLKVGLDIYELPSCQPKLRAI